MFFFKLTTFNILDNLLTSNFNHFFEILSFQINAAEINNTEVIGPVILLGILQIIQGQF